MFKNVAVIPPGTGTAHQVNLEYLSRVVCEEKGVLFPDSVVGTDSHVTMVNGLGILGWGESTTGCRGQQGHYRRGLHSLTWNSSTKGKPDSAFVDSGVAVRAVCRCRRGCRGAGDVRGGDAVTPC